MGNNGRNNVIGLGFTAGLGVFIDLILLSTTSAIWRDLFHELILELQAETGWAADIVLTLLDGVLAVLIIGGVGFVVAGAIVSAVAAAHTRQ